MTQDQRAKHHKIMKSIEKLLRLLAWLGVITTDENKWPNYDYVFLLVEFKVKNEDGLQGIKHEK